MSPTIIDRLMDWFFGLAFLFAIGFLLKCLESLIGGRSQLDFHWGAYHYSGPFHACPPVLLIGGFALAGCVVHLTGAFRQGKRISESDRLSRRD